MGSAFSLAISLKPGLGRPPVCLDGLSDPAAKCREYTLGGLCRRGCRSVVVKWGHGICPLSLSIPMHGSPSPISRQNSGVPAMSRSGGVIVSQLQPIKAARAEAEPDRRCGSRAATSQRGPLIGHARLDWEISVPPCSSLATFCASPHPLLSIHSTSAKGSGWGSCSVDTGTVRVRRKREAMPSFMAPRPMGALRRRPKAPRVCSAARTKGRRRPGYDGALHLG